MNERAPLAAAIYLFGGIVSSILSVADMPLAAALLCASAALAFCYTEIVARRSGIVHLDIAFVLFFTIYSLNVPIFAHLTPKYLSLDLIDRSLLICIFCHIGLALGFFFVRFVSYGTDSARPIDRYSFTPRQMNLASYLLFFFGLAASIVAVIATVGFEAYLSAGYAGRALLKRDAGPIEIGLYICATSLIAIFSVRYIYAQRNFLGGAFLYSATAIFIAYVTYLGIRRPIFLLIAGLFSAYSIIKYRPRILPSLAFVIPVFLIFSTFAHYRQIISSDGPIAAIEFISNNASVEWLDVSDNELGAPFRTLYDEIPYVDQAGFSFGLSYLTTPIYMLPSAINGGVTSLSVKYTDRHFDQRFISIGGNMGYFPVTEAYVNFGIPGCIIMFSFMSAILGWTNTKFFLYYRGSPLALTLFAVLIPWLAFFIRLDFGSFAKSLVYSQLVCFPALYILAGLFRSGTSSGGNILEKPA